MIDEGVDVSHPDLRDNVWKNPGVVPANGVDDDGNGYVDDVNGYDFANDDASVYDPDPINGTGDEHGTHVAGTIAAEGNNGVGITGVNWQAKVMALKFLGPGGGSTLDAVEAIDYAIANGADISNNSWGYVGGPSRSLQEAITRADNAGHLFVAAAGNGGRTARATTTIRLPPTRTTPPRTRTPTSSPSLPRTTRTPWLRSRTSGRAPWTWPPPG